MLPVTPSLILLINLDLLQNVFKIYSSILICQQHHRACKKCGAIIAYISEIELLNNLSYSYKATIELPTITSYGKAPCITISEPSIKLYHE